MDKLDNKIKNSTYAEKWNIFKKSMLPNSTAVADNNARQNNSDNAKPANLATNVGFVEQSAVLEEIARLRERAQNQD